MSNSLKTSVALEEEVKTSDSVFNAIIGYFIPNYNATNVAVLRLEGLIGDVSRFKSSLKFSHINQLIEKTFKVRNLQAVFLVINSPGGSPVQSELIASRIINLSKEKNIPVYSFVEDIAASGGYWLACAGEQIFASKNSIIGSIGVTYTGFGFTKLIDKLGVERRIFTQGKNKSVLDPFVPTKESDIELIQDIQKDIHKNFIEYIMSRRGGKINQSKGDLFQGNFWSGERSLSLGLIDGIEDIFSFIKKKYPSSNIKYMEGKKSWFKDKLGLQYQNLDPLSLNLIKLLENQEQDNRFKFF
ncbi:MAG: S49 family peptidase [Rickettsia sp.]|nr:S49 family peptidase [Rickettsia sp.]